MSDDLEVPERLTRWRLILGSGEADGVTHDGARLALSDDDANRDRVLTDLYDGARRGGLGGSQPKVARWLGDIRTYFPSSVVQVMQGDAMERLGLRQLLLEPETMRAVQPDVALVATLIGLTGVIPEHSRETARQVVRQVSATSRLPSPRSHCSAPLCRPSPHTELTLATTQTSSRFQPPSSKPSSASTCQRIVTSWPRTRGLSATSLNTHALSSWWVVLLPSPRELRLAQAVSSLTLIVA